MKPRGEELKAQHDSAADHTERAIIDAKMESEMPAAEGQPESLIGPVLERQQVEQGSDHLETGKVQNLDSAEPESVAQSESLMALQEALEASAVSEPLVDKMAEYFAAEIAKDSGFNFPFTERTGQVDLAVVRESQRTAPRIHSLGEQENGSYKLVTTIPEGYVEAVRQWAEGDGVTMEEWVDRQLSAYLENWGSPARGR
jgi:hypothetical protein